MIDSVEVISCRWYTYYLYSNWSKPQTSEGSTKKPKMTKSTFLVNKYVRSSILRNEILSGKAEEIHHFFHEFQFLFGFLSTFDVVDVVK